MLERLSLRASDLTQAYEANDSAFAAYERAEIEYNANPCEVNASTLVDREAAWDDARDAIITKAQYLMGTLAILLASKPYDDDPSLAQKTQYLKDAFRAEAVAFNRYSLGGAMEMQQAWQDTRGEIASRARPLAALVASIVKAAQADPFEGSSPTEVGA